MTIPTLNAVTILQTSTTGFNYPQTAQVVALLGDGSSTGGNAVLQQSALTLRQCSILFDAEHAAVAAHRTLYESKAAVTYVDENGDSWTVRVLDFGSSLAGFGIWSCSATLIEADLVEGS